MAVAVNLPFYPDSELKKFGEEVMSSLFDSDVQRSMAGLGGCKAFDLQNFPPEHHPYIEAYAKGNLDSLAVTFAAMRAKQEAMREAEQSPDGTTLHEAATTLLMALQTLVADYERLLVESRITKRDAQAVRDLLPQYTADARQAIALGVQVLAGDSPDTDQETAQHEARAERPRA